MCMCVQMLRRGLALSSGVGILALWGKHGAMFQCSWNKNCCFHLGYGCLSHGAGTEEQLEMQSGANCCLSNRLESS